MPDTIYCIHLDKIASDGRHTVGFFTDRDAAESACEQHNAEHPNEHAHVWDYPMGILLSDGIVG